MPRLTPAADVARRIIEKQLRYIDKMDPCDLSPTHINLVLDYFKATQVKGKAADENPLSDASAEDLLRIINEG